MERPCLVSSAKEVFCALALVHPSSGAFRVSHLRTWLALESLHRAAVTSTLMFSASSNFWRCGSFLRPECWFLRCRTLTVGVPLTRNTLQMGCWRSILVGVKVNGCWLERHRIVVRSLVVKEVGISSQVERSFLKLLVTVPKVAMLASIVRVHRVERLMHVEVIGRRCLKSSSWSLIVFHRAQL